MGTELRGLPVDIYKNGSGYDCTNGGVTAKAARALLVGPEIDIGTLQFEPSPGDAVLVIERWKGAYRAVPWLPEGEPRPWFMFGGNFVYTSDDRMPRAGLNGWSLPIPVHDRVER